ncbi:MAG TPA: DUF1844 domain-containing protein [Anaeromyxobacteraceae bacterium]|nr:DUF1844 domain-containing protein [Anaeromyxobacteraceae bacterium]
MADEPQVPREIDFTTFVISLGSSAFVHLGEVPHPESQVASPNLVLAKQTIDILGMLQAKTRGNLTPEEEKLLEHLLLDLRLRYVEKTAAAPG